MLIRLGHSILYPNIRRKVLLQVKSRHFYSTSQVLSQDLKTDDKQDTQNIKDEFQKSRNIVNKFYEKVASNNKENKKIPHPNDAEPLKPSSDSAETEALVKTKPKRTVDDDAAPYEKFIYEEFPKNPEKMSAKNLLGFENDYPIGAADQKLVRQAYFNAARRYHPDLHDESNMSENEKNNRKNMFVLLNKAYESLIRSEDLYAILGINKKGETLEDLNRPSMKKTGHEGRIDRRNRGTGPAVIFMAYNSKARLLQQDFDNPNRAKEFADLRRAFIILSNADLRAEYDNGIFKMTDDIYDVAKRHEIVDLRAEVRKEKVRTKIVKFWKWYWLPLFLIGFLSVTPLYTIGDKNPNAHFIVDERNYEHYKRNKHLYQYWHFNVFKPWEAVDRLFG